MRIVFKVSKQTFDFILEINGQQQIKTTIEKPIRSLSFGKVVILDNL